LAEQLCPRQSSYDVRMHRPQFTIRRLLIAIAVCAAYFVLLGQFLSATIGVTIALGLAALAVSILEAVERLLVNLGWDRNAIGCALVIVGAALPGIALWLIGLAIAFARGRMWQQ